LGGAAVAADATRGAQATGSTPNRSSATAALPAVQCNGGAQKAVRTTLDNQFVVFGEGGDFILPGATVTLAGPSVGADTVNVTFSAEAQLRGSTPGDNFDWAEVEVLLDGLPMRPFGPADSPMALNGSPFYHMNTAQFCGRIGAGTHRLQVRLRLADNGTPDTLVEWIDDWVLKAEVSE
jgi:hypothetical protein